MFDFLAQKFSSFFSHFDSAGSVTQESIEEVINHISSALLEADVPYSVTQSFIASIRNDFVDGNKSGVIKSSDQLLLMVQEKVTAFLAGDSKVLSQQLPAVMMVIGLQGSGKTTTLGKIAYKIKKDAQKEGIEKKILLASVDFYRPAAIDQLEILSKRAGAGFYRARSENAVLAAKEIYEFYKSNSYDHLLLDTAGRLHVDNTMLQELQDIDALVQPNYKFFILDAMTGQESLAIAKAFDDIVSFHGAILTKMDSDARGGAAFSFRYVLKKPIVFVGQGEDLADLQLFFPDRAAERIVGMGDLKSLIERAEETIGFEEQSRAEKALKEGVFTLQDFADQMAMINKIGSLSQLLKYMPGTGVKVSPEMIQKGEVELAKYRSIISSMNKKERLGEVKLDPLRIKRIAEGAGVSSEDVLMLLKRFEEAKQYVKMLKSSSF